MDPALQVLLVALGGFLAGSGGFWVYLTRKFEHKDHIEKLIMGLAHDKIIYLGLKYIEQGYVNEDEFADLFKYFWEPYCALGGNSSAKRIITLVEVLPLKPEQREFPEVRRIADGLEVGSERVIDRLEKGDIKFERGRGRKHNS